MFYRTNKVFLLALNAHFYNPYALKVQSEEPQSSISPGDGTELQSTSSFDQFNVTGNSFVLTLGIDFHPRTLIRIRIG